MPFAVVPEFSVSEPDTPFVPPAADAIVTEPLDVAEPTPLVSERAPPAFTVLLPADSVISPPAPLVPLPTLIVTAPPVPPVAAPEPISSLPLLPLHPASISLL